MTKTPLQEAYRKFLKIDSTPGVPGWRNASTAVDQEMEKELRELKGVVEKIEVFLRGDHLVVFLGGLHQVSFRNGAFYSLNEGFSAEQQEIVEGVLTDMGFLVGVG